MANADTFAIAAHLHVLLRRKTGRVTDTEWMATNADYARAIAQLARDSGESLPDEELLKWAEKLEQALPAIAAPPPARPLIAVAKDAVRYMGGLR
jgi:hypothetical protein